MALSTLACRKTTRTCLTKETKRKAKCVSGHTEYSSGSHRREFLLASRSSIASCGGRGLTPVPFLPYQPPARVQARRGACNVRVIVVQGGRRWWRRRRGGEREACQPYIACLSSPRFFFVALWSLPSGHCLYRPLTPTHHPATHRKTRRIKARFTWRRGLGLGRVV